MSLWFVSGCSWVAQFRLQQSSGQDSQTPCTDRTTWSHVPLPLPECPSPTCRLISVRREKTWRHNTHSLAEPQVIVLGCYGHLPFVESYIEGAARQAGRVNSRNGSLNQTEIYWDWGPSQRFHRKGLEDVIFQPIAMETLGVFSCSSRQFLCSLCRRISSRSGKARYTCFLFHRISVLQRFNAVLLHDCLLALDCADWESYLLFISHFSIFFLSKSLEGIKNKIIIIIIIIIICYYTKFGRNGSNHMGVGRKSQKRPLLLLR